jgi:hypothetical protein
MGNLVKFFIVWYSQNMAIPFWVIGHINLSINVYEDWQEYGASIIMHIMVLVGFVIDYKESKKKSSK